MTAGGVISGRVYDQDGHPVEGVLIHSLVRRYQPDGTVLLSELNIARTNDIGEYRMYWMSPGTYYLVATVYLRDAVPRGSTVINQSEESTDTFAPTFYPNGHGRLAGKLSSDRARYRVAGNRLFPQKNEIGAREGSHHR